MQYLFSLSNNLNNLVFSHLRNIEKI